MTREMILQEQITKLEKEKVDIFKELSNLTKLYKEEYFDKGVLMSEKEFEILSTFYYGLLRVNYSLDVLYEIKRDSEKK